MEIKNNVLKESLKNVYFVAGVACGGKSTASRALAEKHGFLLYDADREFDRHRSLSNPADQPEMNRSFANADEFFLRPVEEYTRWLVLNTREQLDFIIADLIRLSAQHTVVADLHLTLEEARALTDENRIAFLIRSPENIIDDYCNRPDHTDFADFINSACDPERAKANCNATLAALNRSKYAAIKSSGYFWLERDETSTVEKTLRLLEQHFGL